MELDSFFIIVIIGVLLGIVYSLKKIFGLEKRIINMEARIASKVVRKKVSRRKKK
ncbi:hypothetical protein GOV03_02835 [Candidatus Woesearchaeota archaeon]|nr:hypothetical protein [Candidatus Woesearchaeota archaeon]